MRGHPWTEEENVILTRLWLRGKAAKLIVHDLPGRSENACRKHATETLGLSVRRVKSTKDGRQNKITLYVTEDQKRFIARRAFERGQPENDYMRVLINRDMGR